MWGIGYVIGLVGAVMGIGVVFSCANVDLFSPYADRDSNRYRRGAYYRDHGGRFTSCTL